MTILDDINKQREEIAYKQSDQYKQDMLKKQIDKCQKYLYDEYVRILKQLAATYGLYYENTIFKDLIDQIKNTLATQDQIELNLNNASYMQHYKTKFDHTDGAWNDYYNDVWQQVVVTNDDNKQAEALHYENFNHAIGYLINQKSTRSQQIINNLIDYGNQKLGYNAKLEMLPNQIKITMHPVPYIDVEYLENPEHDFAHWNELSIKLNLTEFAQYLITQGLKVTIVDTDHLIVKYPRN